MNIDRLYGSGTTFSTQTVLFPQQFSSIPKVLTVWQSLDLNTGANEFKIGGPLSLVITTTGVDITSVLFGTSSINAFTVQWLAILDPNIFIMSKTMGSGSSTLTTQTITFDTTISGTPACAFFINGIKQTTTPSSSVVSFRFYKISLTNSQIVLQLEAMPAGYALTQAFVSFIYGSSQYLSYQEWFVNGPQVFNMMTLGSNVKIAIAGINGIKCNTELKVQVSNVAGSVTVTKTGSTVIELIQLSMLAYMPCAGYCTACTAGFPICDACVTSTQRSGSDCTTCPAQMFQTSTAINCQTCSTSCDGCSGTAAHCVSCSAITNTINPPNCNTCITNWFLQTNTCYECLSICNGCTVSNSNCIACSAATFRINAPSCNACPSNKTLVPGMDICQDCPTNYYLSGTCQPCQTYCDGCTSNTNCIVCAAVTQRLTPPLCITCPSQMTLLTGDDNCQQCSNYCDGCSGHLLNCTSCLATTSRILPPSCLQCSPQFYLISSNVNCLPCSNYCNQCTLADTQCTLCNVSSLRTNPPNCNTCASHYYAAFNVLNCQPCSQKCDDCFANELQCLTCSLSSKRLNPPNCADCLQFMYAEANSCIQCDTSCASCNQLGCLTCLAESQFINQNHVCVNCPSHCSLCDNQNCYSCSGNCKLCDFNACLSCNSNNYYISGTNCMQCPAGCATCNSEQCLTCLQPRTLINHMCQCQTPCLSCDSHQCLSCISDEYKVINKKCFYCPSRCLICDENANCVSAPPNCKTVIITETSEVQCTTCIQDYFLKNKFCNKCALQCLECTDSAENCISCRFPTSETKSCSICEQQYGYYTNLANNSCYTRCGDGIIAGSEECDDGNDVQVDGCVSCKVSSGYHCQGFVCQTIRYPIPIIQENINQTTFYNDTKLLILQYDIPVSIINISELCSLELNNNISLNYTWNQIDQQTYQINLTMQNESINSILNLKFLNKSMIVSDLGANQQIQTLSIKISNYIVVSNSEQTITEVTNASIPYAIIIIISCVCLAILFGGIETYWNLLDLLQTISYLQYVNAFQPYNVNSFLDQFSFLQFQNLPLNKQLNSQSFVQSQINTDDFRSPPAVIANSGYSCSTILNIIPTANLFAIMTILYYTAKFIGPLISKIQIEKVTFNTLSRRIKFYLMLYYLKHFMVNWCKNIEQQWVWSGIVRFYISSAYEISFIIALGIHGFQYQNQSPIITADSFVTLTVILMQISLSVAITIICGFSKQTLSTKTHRYGSIYQGLSFGSHSKYYNIVILHKKLIFTLILVLLYDEPIFQIFGIILVQVSQFIFLIILDPLVSRLEKYKQILSEFMMLFSQCSLGVLIADDYSQFLIYDYRVYCGWACISFLSIIIAAQLFIDAFQQFRGYYRQFGFIRRFVNNCLGKKPPQKKIFTEINNG